MSTTFFPCEACILTCGPCPSPLKINGHKYNRMGCSGGVYGLVETLISLGVYLESGAYPATGITLVQAKLAYIGSPTVIAATAGMTIGTRFYRPDTGISCDFTAGSMYVLYDATVYIIHSFAVTRTFPATGSTIDTLYVSDNPGYGCVPCTNQAGFLVHKIGGTEGYNTVNLAPSRTGAIGEVCDPSSGESPARVKGVEAWIAGGDPCCATPAATSYPIAIAGGCAASASKNTIYKDGSVCGSSESAAVACALSAGVSGVPDLAQPDSYSVSGTGTVSIAQGDASVSLTFARTSCGVTTLTGSIAATSNAPLGSGANYSASVTETGEFFINVGNPCHRIKVNFTVDGSYSRSSNSMWGYNFSLALYPGCYYGGYGVYDDSSAQITISNVRCQVVAL